MDGGKGTRSVIIGDDFNVRSGKKGGKWRRKNGSRRSIRDPRIRR